MPRKLSTTPKNREMRLRGALKRAGQQLVSAHRRGLGYVVLDAEGNVMAWKLTLDQVEQLVDNMETPG